jgi:competence protein ComEA
VKELERLPGIGPALARRIVEFRERRRGFKRVEELLAVPGISEKKWKVIRDKVEVK